MYPTAQITLSTTSSHPWVPPGDHTVSKLSADAGSLCSEVYSRPPDLKSSSNVSLTFAWITGPETKAIKSSPLLGPFGDSEFWGFSLLKI